MKYLLLSFVLIASCANRDVSKSTTQLQIIRATKQDWAGGMKGSGGGTNYEILFVSPDNNNLFIANDLWIGEDYYLVKPIKYKIGDYNRNIFSKGDTLIISLSLNKEKGEKEINDNSLMVKKPDGRSGEATLGYKLKGKQIYSDIPKFTVLQRQNRP